MLQLGKCKFNLKNIVIKNLNYDGCKMAVKVVIYSIKNSYFIKWPYILYKTKKLIVLKKNKNELLKVKNSVLVCTTTPMTIQ